jgi:hypothetical protein
MTELIINRNLSMAIMCAEFLPLIGAYLENIWGTEIFISGYFEIPSSDPQVKYKSLSVG